MHIAETTRKKLYNNHQNISILLPDTAIQWSPEYTVQISNFYCHLARDQFVRDRNSCWCKMG